MLNLYFLIFDLDCVLFSPHLSSLTIWEGLIIIFRIHDLSSLLPMSKLKTTGAPILLRRSISPVEGRVGGVEAKKARNSKKIPFLHVKSQQLSVNNDSDLPIRQVHPWCRLCWVNICQMLTVQNTVLYGQKLPLPVVLSVWEWSPSPAGTCSWSLGDDMSQEALGNLTVHCTKGYKQRRWWVPIKRA